MVATDRTPGTPRAPRSRSRHPGAHRPKARGLRWFRSVRTRAESFDPEGRARTVGRSRGDGRSVRCVRTGDTPRADTDRTKRTELRHPPVGYGLWPGARNTCTSRGGSGPLHSSSRTPGPQAAPRKPSRAVRSARTRASGRARRSSSTRGRRAVPRAACRPCRIARTPAGTPDSRRRADGAEAGSAQAAARCSPAAARQAGRAGAHRAGEARRAGARSPRSAPPARRPGPTPAAPRAAARRRGHRRRPHPPSVS